MKKSELLDALRTHIHNMILDRHIEPSSIPYLMPQIEKLLEERDQALVTALADLVKDWEQAMGPDDKSLYTLGLRKAIDLIREEEYKPLDKDYRKKDTPTE